MTRGVINLMSADVEDYYSLVARDQLGADVPVSGRVVEAQTRRLLDLLDELGLSATCFVVGQVARACPDLVREILRRGHEVGSHGHHHLAMDYLTPAAFADDLRTSLAVLSDLAGRPVQAFRAPAFSLRPHHRWAFEIMAEHGVRIDSSVRVIWPFGLKAGVTMIRAAAAFGITEVPGAALGVGRLAVPLGGGGGLRLLPAAVTRVAVHRINRAGLPVPLYIHPYDVGPENPPEAWPAGPLVARFRMVVFNAAQRIGRNRIVPHLHAVLAVSSVGRILSPVPPPSTPGPSSVHDA